MLGFYLFPLLSCQLLLQVKKEAVTDAMKRALRNFGNLMGNCIYDKKFLDDISKVKAPGKVPLDFSTLHRPGQAYDIDGKIIPAGMKAELDKAPTAGPSNAGQAKVPNDSAQQANQSKQQTTRQTIEAKPAPPHTKQQMPVHKMPQMVQQGQRPQANAAQMQQNPLLNQERNVPQGQRTLSPRKQQGTMAIVQNRPQIDPNKSLDSEDMYEGMDDGDNDLEEDAINPKYDDSGFDEGNTSAQSHPHQPPQNQHLRNRNNRNQVPQLNQNRNIAPQKQLHPMQQQQQNPNIYGVTQGGRENFSIQNNQSRVQQVYQNHPGLPKQVPPVGNAPTSHNAVSYRLMCSHKSYFEPFPFFSQAHVRQTSGEHRQNAAAIGRYQQEQNNTESGDQQYLYAQTQPVRSQTHRTSGNQPKQSQSKSPVNQLNPQHANPRLNTIAHSTTSGVPPLANVNFKSSSIGVKRPLPSE